jgi:hypothetical protein
MAAVTQAPRRRLAAAPSGAARREVIRGRSYWTLDHQLHPHVTQNAVNRWPCLVRLLPFPKGGPTEDWTLALP